MTVEDIPIEALTPYARNSRTHSSEQVEQIVASIREYGWTNPVLIDEHGTIIAGHGRVMAAERLGMERVPCIRLVGLTEAQKRAYVIADNKLALNAGWDEELLAAELAALQEMDFDLSLTGFSDDETTELLALLDATTPEGNTDPDAVPEPPAEPVSKRGDIWLLGPHRLMCGDSTSAEDVARLMDGVEYDVCVFDPPFDNEHLYDLIPTARAGQKLVVFWDMYRFAQACVSAVRAGWSPLYELIWDNITSWYVPNRPLARHKACGIFGDDPKWNFDEAIIYDGKMRDEKTVRNPRGEYRYTPLKGAVHMRTIEAFPTTAESGGHIHSKPVAWLSAMFNGVGGRIYLDMFGGSGSSLIACEKTSRVCYVMELEPRYCDVIIDRWQTLTGGQPKRVAV